MDPIEVFELAYLKTAIATLRQHDQDEAAKLETGWGEFKARLQQFHAEVECLRTMLTDVDGRLNRLSALYRQEDKPRAV
jgi:hypothetical protein